MKFVKVSLLSVICLFATAACSADLYEYRVTCDGDSEPIVVRDSMDQYVSLSIYDSTHLELDVYQRGTRKEIREIHKIGVFNCKIEKTYVGNTEPQSNDN